MRSSHDAVWKVEDEGLASPRLQRSYPAPGACNQWAGLVSVVLANLRTTPDHTASIHVCRRVCRACQASWPGVPGAMCACSLLVHVGTSSGLNRSPSRSSSTSSCHWGSGDGGGDSRVGGSRGSRDSGGSGGVRQRWAVEDLAHLLIEGSRLRAGRRRHLATQLPPLDTVSSDLALDGETR